MLNLIRRFVTEESGIEIVEWALVATLFAVAAAGFYGTLAGDVGTSLDNIGSQIRGGN